MFREIRLNPEEKDSHRFLIKDTDGRIQDMRMLRLTFGVRCSPFLATQVLRHLASTHKESFPTASQAIENNFYVDDFLSGAETVQEAEATMKVLCSLMVTAGMTLRKWRLNSGEFLLTVPPTLREEENLLINSTDKPLKTLGIHWDTARDQLSVSIPTTTPNEKVTKRTMVKFMTFLDFTLQLLSRPRFF